MGCLLAGEARYLLIGPWDGLHAVPPSQRLLSKPNVSQHIPSKFEVGTLGAGTMNLHLLTFSFVWAGLADKVRRAFQLAPGTG